MNKLLPRLAAMAAVGCLLSPEPMPAQVSPTTPKVARVRIIQGPEIELAKEHLTIIRWTTNNPGGSPVHNGIVHYGTDPKKPEPNREISHQTKSGPFLYNFPRPPGRP